MATPKRLEYIKRKTATKDVYYYLDQKEGIDVLSREVYKRKPLEIHYPFDRKGQPKYKFIRSVEFRDISPHNVPGVFTAPNFGLGFTKNINPVIYQFENLPGVSKVVISPKLISKVDRTVATFNTADLEFIFKWVKPVRDTQYAELKKVANNALAKVYPAKFKLAADKYTKGQLGIFVKNKNLTSDQLSVEDVGHALKLIPDHITEESLFYKTEEKINFIRLNEVKKEFKKLVAQKTDTKKFEEKCQKFFTDNNWILSNILSIPVAFLAGKAYVGGKTIFNKAGKEADFLYKNNLTQNVSIIEIKTPLKKLIDTKTAYRKPDVFALGKELTGGLIQVLDQKDTLQKDFYALSRGEEFKSFNPKGLLIIGKIKDLSKNQLKSFELFRSNLRDIEIITYDELLERTDLILKQFVANE